MIQQISLFLTIFLALRVVSLDPLVSYLYLSFILGLSQYSLCNIELMRYLALHLESTNNGERYHFGVNVFEWSSLKMQCLNLRKKNSSWVGVKEPHACMYNVHPFIQRIAIWSQHSLCILYVLMSCWFLSIFFLINSSSISLWLIFSNSVRYLSVNLFFPSKSI